MAGGGPPSPQRNVRELHAWQFAGKVAPSAAPDKERFLQLAGDLRRREATIIFAGLGGAFLIGGALVGAIWGINGGVAGSIFFGLLFLLFGVGAGIAWRVNKLQP